MLKHNVSIGLTASAVALTCVLFTITSVAAQTRTQSVGVTRSVRDASLPYQTFEQYQFSQMMDHQAALKPLAPERVALARRAAELINAGRCTAARDLAVNAKDGQMARRIVASCKGVKN